MKKMIQISQLTSGLPIRGIAWNAAVGLGIGALLALSGAVIAQAQEAATENQPAPTHFTVPEGFSSHATVDVGGHISSVTGSPAMYSTLVNQQSGPRILGQTFRMRALPGTKHTWVDSLTAVSGGFGGDPVSFARLDFSKGTTYDFSGVFRRGRQYFDYGLLGNPNIAPGKSIPIGPSASPTGSIPWGPVNHSSVLFNTVRRMTDTSLTILPVARVTYRFGYAQNVMEGPTLSPSYTIMKYNALLRQYQRNSTDDFSGAIEWKPVPTTRLTYEERITHYKADSFFTLDPNGFLVQEADGTPAYLGNWNSQSPYSSSACNAASMGGGDMLSPANTSGGLPIINPACSVVTSYTRTQPTRILTPTSIFRLQSSSIKNLTMNGMISYTRGNMNLPAYYEDVQGLNTGSTSAVRESTYSGGYASAHRSVTSVDFGVVWQVAPAFSLADQIDYWNIQEPGTSLVPAPATLSTPGAPNQTITYTGPLTPGTGSLPHGIDGVLKPNFYGDKMTSNLFTASWDVNPRVHFALGYRHKSQRISQGEPHNIPIPAEENDPINGYVNIATDGGILNVALRPTAKWDVNGTIEIAYSDNAFTSVSPRQFKQYRIHTKYRPTKWAILNGSFSDRERHNNTFNNQIDQDADDYIYQGPLDHVDQSRWFGVGASLAPSEKFSIDMNYGYNDVYTATNICFTSAASATQAGTATTRPDGTPAICPGIFARGSTTILVDWFARDFMDAPTQFGNVALSVEPLKKIRADLGYTVSSVNGNQFFTDARAVNGSLASTYQSPFVKLAWTLRPGLTWKAEYNFYGYGEGGASGAQYCSTSTSPTATIVPCADMTLATGRNAPTSAGYTAPRNFHANNVTFAMRYEF
ncbi:MAG: hypothetical protein KGN79_02425 [Acidobacteriota bacterium]|nr:hypothetical protein [Acidobacteriota bacterium]